MEVRISVKGMLRSMYTTKIAMVISEGSSSVLAA
jgi:hypothetical protein